ncbi:hypothetical protein, partial [Haemophilus parainfluenzae]|uniref:hypothetical protein n=1 Tax=Haemophilus parainfluenzae TaxID=729 RepID=UPI001CEC8B95
ARFRYRLQIGKPFNTIIKKIKGENNTIGYGDSILSSVVFEISGNSNEILIEDSCYLDSLKFYIKGDGHKIRIAKGCRLDRGGSIWFEDSRG